MTDEENIQLIETTCCHRRGAGLCVKGHNTESLRDKDGRLPCYTAVEGRPRFMRGGATTCPDVEFPTHEAARTAYYDLVTAAEDEARRRRGG